MLPQHALANRSQCDPLENSQAQLAVLQRLSQEISQLEGTAAGRTCGQRARSSSGCDAMDALLPRGGYAAGSIVEYLRSTPACGASTLAWAAAAAAMQTTSGFLVVVDTLHSIYPPPLLCHGIDLAKVIFVRPQSQADALWAVDQALRTMSVAAVVAELERIDDRSARRLQLAAESGQSLALLLRGWQARQQPSWADVQWLVRSELADSNPCADREQHRRQLNRRWHVQLARIRGGQAGRSTRLEMDPLNGQLRLAPHDNRLVRKGAIPLSRQARSLSHGVSPPLTQASFAPPASFSTHPSNSHERTTSPTASPQPSSGALHLAAQLAHTASRPAAATAARGPALDRGHIPPATTRRASAG